MERGGKKAGKQASRTTKKRMNKGAGLRMERGGKKAGKQNNKKNA